MHPPVVYESNAHTLRMFDATPEQLIDDVRAARVHELPDRQSRLHAGRCGLLPARHVRRLPRRQGRARAARRDGRCVAPAPSASWRGSSRSSQASTSSMPRAQVASIAGASAGVAARAARRTTGTDRLWRSTPTTPWPVEPHGGRPGGRAGSLDGETPDERSRIRWRSWDGPCTTGSRRSASDGACGHDGRRRAALGGEGDVGVGVAPRRAAGGRRRRMPVGVRGLVGRPRRPLRNRRLRARHCRVPAAERALPRPAVGPDRPARPRSVAGRVDPLHHP